MRIIEDPLRSFRKEIPRDTVGIMIDELTLNPLYDNKSELRIYLERYNFKGCDCDQDCVFKRLWERLRWLEACV